MRIWLYRAAPLLWVTTLIVIIVWANVGGTVMLGLLIAAASFLSAVLFLLLERHLRLRREREDWPPSPD
jgi:hypothetical protein